MSSLVPLSVARHVLWHFGDRNLGIDGGHFANRLLVLASAADEANLEKLRHEWPAYMTAFEAVKNEPWGLDWLRGIAKAYLDGLESGLDLFGARS